MQSLANVPNYEDRFGFVRDKLSEYQLNLDYVPEKYLQIVVAVLYRMLTEKSLEAFDEEEVKRLIVQEMLTNKLADAKVDLYKMNNEAELILENIWSFRAKMLRPKLNETDYTDEASEQVLAALGEELDPFAKGIIVNVISKVLNEVEVISVRNILNQDYLIALIVEVIYTLHKDSFESKPTIAQVNKFLAKKNLSLDYFVENIIKVIKNG